MFRGVLARRAGVGEQELGLAGQPRVEPGDVVAQHVPLGLLVQRDALEGVGRAGLEAVLGHPQRQGVGDLALADLADAIEELAQVGDVGHGEPVVLRVPGQWRDVLGVGVVREARGAGATEAIAVARPRAAPVEHLEVRAQAEHLAQEAPGRQRLGGRLAVGAPGSQLAQQDLVVAVSAGRQGRAALVVWLAVELGAGRDARAGVGVVAPLGGQPTGLVGLGRAAARRPHPSRHRATSP